MANTHGQPAHAVTLAGPALLRELADKWWLLLLRGIAAIAFGILTFMWPGLTLFVLILLWGAYALADGILALWVAFSRQGGDMAPRWWLVIAGIAGILAGLLTFFWPGVTAIVLLMFIAVWSIITGALQIWGAFHLRKEIEGEWLLMLGGALSILFGIVLIVQPGAGALALAWMIGFFAILAGCVYVALAFRLKKHKQPG